MSTFIETQFPIARLSAESLPRAQGGFWSDTHRPWQMVGAQAAHPRPRLHHWHAHARFDCPEAGSRNLLKILTMDDEGVWQRLKPAARRKISRTSFDALTYAERIKDCERPESVDGPSGEAWAEINAHLGTSATSLPELVEQLGQRAFGHTPRVGDAFCGGGSIPFEASRIGCAAFGSDLNPVAGLLTWASLNLLGGDKAVQDEVRTAQKAAFAEADQQITKWRIEHNERGERAEAFLYCVEVKPEGCEYYIPLAPSWVVDEYSKVVVRWHQVPGSDRLKPEVAVVSDAEIAECKKTGATVIDSRVVDPFDSNRSWSIEALRGPDGLRRWTNDDFVPRPGDVFQERLYCVRWVGADGGRRYAAPDDADLAREARVLELLRERFADWQREGFIPSMAIPEGGDKTEEPIRNRGWTHWHHLFTPRQLLTHGLIASHSMKASSQHLLAAATLNIGRISGWNSRLSQWLSSKTQIATNLDHRFHPTPMRRLR
jgi:putative DNA methylase